MRLGGFVSDSKIRRDRVRAERRTNDACRARSCVRVQTSRPCVRCKPPLPGQRGIWLATSDEILTARRAIADAPRCAARRPRPCWMRSEQDIAGKCPARLLAKTPTTAIRSTKGVHTTLSSCRPRFDREETAEDGHARTGRCASRPGVPSARLRCVSVRRSRARSASQPVPARTLVQHRRALARNLRNLRGSRGSRRSRESLCRENQRPDEKAGAGTAAAPIVLPRCSLANPRTPAIAVNNYEVSSQLCKCPRKGKEDRRGREAHTPRRDQPDENTGSRLLVDIGRW